MSDSPRQPNNDLAGEFYFEEGCFITELSNTEEDPALSISRTRIPVGTTTKRHRLNGIVERYIVERGVGEIEIGDVRTRVTAGDIVVIPAGESQRLRNQGETDMHLLTLCTPRFEFEAYENLELGDVSVSLPTAD